MSQILIIAGKEIRDSLRNRWLLMISLILLILSLCITFGGSAISGVLTIPELGNAISALVTLSVFLLPLAAILLSYDAFIGEQEAGTLLLILTYPLSRFELLFGKFLGHATLLTLACLLGFMPAAVMLNLVGNVGLSSLISGFGHFMLSGLMLALVFILLGYLVSLSVKEKAKALGILLFLWFTLVLIYDLALLAVVVSLADVFSRNTLNWLIVLNPADLFRTINLEALSLSGNLANHSSQSALAALSQTGLGLGVLYCIMFCWLAALLGMCQLRFKFKVL